jgi:Icc-related predicted phosphoesterase
MTLLIIADDDAVLGSIPDTQAQVLICCGDLLEAVILAVAAKCRCREILAVKGNHDSSAPFQQPIRDLHLTTYRVGDVTFGGFAGSWKYKLRGNYLFDQDEVERAMISFTPVDVFVAHNSPRLIHDREDEVHTGFTAFANYISRAQPKLFLHGHQHVSIETVVGQTRVIGTYGYRFLMLPE